jgi:hypothetical protein
VDKPRIFIGSSGAQAKLVQALSRGLADVAHLDPWTTSFDLGSTAIERLVELTREVDFAAFVFAGDDWTTTAAAAPAAGSGQSSPRDNVVFEAGLFGGVLGMRRTFILHARTSKLPSDLLGLTAVRYGDASSAVEVKGMVKKLREAIESQGRAARIEGLWWQYSLTERSREPSAVSLLRVSRDRFGALEVAGRGWRADGSLSVRYWSEATKERQDPSGLFYYFRGERPREPDAPATEGTAQILLESADRGAGYYAVHADGAGGIGSRTSGVYLRADPADAHILDSGDNASRAALLADRLRQWRGIVDH